MFTANVRATLPGPARPSHEWSATSKFREAMSSTEQERQEGEYDSSG